MARIGGRNSWIAVPAGLVCAGVVGALVWLALPMVPVTVAWVGDTLRSATAPQPGVTAAPTPAQAAVEGAPVDCRTIYPDDLWNELTWQPGSLLNQSAAPPATSATSFRDAAAPDVIVTCTWLSDAGGIVSTLSKVAGDASSIAEAALSGEGFACAAADGGLVCTRTVGAVREDHTFREGLWLASVETDWQPEDFGPRLDRGVWG
ncbi:hypothetical protein R8Z57_13795 [Microbacterium sp. M3]|uniref:Uncharacterized protein n=1 Tax=Microbacterium arthrosphaerae TaxID=792652 RepID=A0ABU4H3E0_9MICO|nr:MULTISPECIES: hypothetical protein [Microbacterium]MDW4573849.1 hypothetical protein [Microbacterium arthrosphaerae]MDW7607704.1 hypothetical protein [Microbacterium sp. M3]